MNEVRVGNVKYINCFLVKKIRQRLLKMSGWSNRRSCDRWLLGTYKLWKPLHGLSSLEQMFQTCRPKRLGYLCRETTQECDLAEYCTGHSEYCPEDVFKMDGSECKEGEVSISISKSTIECVHYLTVWIVFDNSSVIFHRHSLHEKNTLFCNDVLKAYCHKGSCRTHSDQCKLLWGPSGKSSDTQCYMDYNKNGNVIGNCGYNYRGNHFLKCQEQ